MKALVCTALHPSSERYWSEFVASVNRQSVSGFGLLVALDGVGAPALWPNNAPSATVPASGGTIADVRSSLWGSAVERADVIIMADSDDILEPSRVELAIDAHAAGAAVSSCSLALVDEDGCALEVTQGRDVVRHDDLLPAANILGGSNSAFAATVLRELIPVPSPTVVVDWFIALGAWLRGVPFAHSHAIGTRYRQHRNSFIGASRCYDANCIRARAVVVENLLAAVARDAPPTERGELLRRRQADVAAFRTWMGVDKHAARYVAAVNRLVKEGEALPWWKEVACVELEALWRQA
ncbi:MAG: hypothetical protein IT383_18925 [Deltaproteobacteria bacterium]|nr:hypothetical protein [Deltaproteobacteria bacterium]